MFLVALKSSFAVFSTLDVELKFSESTSKNIAVLPEFGLPTNATQGTLSLFNVKFNFQLQYLRHPAVELIHNNCGLLTQ